MVRQRKSHTRLKKVSAVLPDVGREGLSNEGHPEDGRAQWHPFFPPSFFPLSFPLLFPFFSPLFPFSFLPGVPSFFLSPSQHCSFSSFPIPFSPSEMWRGPQAAPHSALLVAQEQPQTLFGGWVFIPGGLLQGLQVMSQLRLAWIQAQERGMRRKSAGDGRRASWRTCSPRTCRWDGWGELEVNGGDGWGSPRC